MAVVTLTAHLFANVSLSFTDSCGHECEFDAEVDYTFDGETLNITAIKSNALNGYDDDIAEDLIWEAVNDLCDEAYAEWLEEYHAARADAPYEARCEREIAA